MNTRIPTYDSDYIIRKLGKHNISIILDTHRVSHCGKLYTNVSIKSITYPVKKIYFTMSESDMHNKVFIIRYYVNNEPQMIPSSLNSSIISFFVPKKGILKR